MGREDGRSDGDARRSAAAKRQGQKGANGKPPGRGFAETERAETSLSLTELMSNFQEKSTAPVPVEGESSTVFKEKTLHFVNNTDNADELNKHAKHADPEIRCAVATNVNTPEVTRTMLLTDDDSQVRRLAQDKHSGEIDESQTVERDESAMRKTRSSRGSRQTRGRPVPPFLVRFPVLGAMRRAVKNIFRF